MSRGKLRERARAKILGATIARAVDLDPDRAGINALMEVAIDIVEALRMYGGHTGGCAVNSSRKPTPDCTCGFADAWARWCE